MPKGSKRNERETKRVKGNSKGNERYKGKRKRNKIYNENERETNGAKMPTVARAAAQATGEWLQPKYSAAFVIARHSSLGVH